MDGSVSEEVLFKCLNDTRGNGLGFVRTDPVGKVGCILVRDRARVKSKLREAVCLSYCLESVVACGAFGQFVGGRPTARRPGSPQQSRADFAALR